MADISKIKLSNGSIVSLKDAKSRSDISTLLGSHALAAIGDAGWLGVDDTLSDSGEGLVKGSVIKGYVDSQVGAINKFDIVVLGASEALPTASADTMYKIYLKPDATASAGTYVEFISVRSGTEGSYTYAWEAIGSTQTDLDGYVKKTAKIAGIDLQDDITVAEMQVALGLRDMAYANTASGSTTLSTIDSITMDEMTISGDATVEVEETTATISQKADFTPAGSIKVAGADQDEGGNLLTGGNIDVTLKDAANDTNATITSESYTPAGTVASTLGTAGESEEGFTITGTVSKPAISLTSSAQDVLTGVKTAGVLPTYEHTGFDGGSLEKGTKISCASNGITAHIPTPEEIAADSNLDTETLVFETASTVDALSYDNVTFTAATYGTDTFTQGSMPEFDEGSVNDVSAAELDAAPEFTGQKLKITSGFTGTAEENLKITAVGYKKQEVDSKTFTPTKAEVSFAGTTISSLIPTEVKYDRSKDKAAYSIKFTPTVADDGITRTAKTIDITVNPDAVVAP